MLGAAEESLRVEAWNALKGAAWTMFRRIQQEMDAPSSDVTHAQRGFLHVLQCEPGPLTPQEIARRCDVTPATVTGMVNKLEEGGYVERLRISPDRRVVHVRVTKKGEELTRTWHARFRKHLDEVLAPLSDDELRTLIGLLTRIGPPIQGPPGGFAALIRRDAGGSPETHAPPPAAKGKPAAKRDKKTGTKGRRVAKAQE